MKVAVIIFPANHRPWRTCRAFIAACVFSNLKYTKPAVFLLIKHIMRVETRNYRRGKMTQALMPNKNLLINKNMFQLPVFWTFLLNIFFNVHVNIWFCLLKKVNSNYSKQQLYNTATNGIRMMNLYRDSVHDKPQFLWDQTYSSTVSIHLEHQLYLQKEQ